MPNFLWNQVADDYNGLGIQRQSNTVAPFPQGVNMQADEQASKNYLLPPQQNTGEIDPAAIHAGISLFEKVRQDLTDNLDKWPQFRSDMVKLGFPGQWLPESFNTVEDLNKFLAHADNQKEKLQTAFPKGDRRGDRPIRDGFYLPSGPSLKGIYDPRGEFSGAMNDAFKYGLIPPEAPTAEAILRFKAQNAPWAEQEILRRDILRRAERDKNPIGI